MSGTQQADSSLPTNPQQDPCVDNPYHISAITIKISNLFSGFFVQKPADPSSKFCNHWGTPSLTTDSAISSQYRPAHPHRYLYNAITSTSREIHPQETRINFLFLLLLYRYALTQGSSNWPGTSIDLYWPDFCLISHYYSASYCCSRISVPNWTYFNFSSTRQHPDLLFYNPTAKVPSNFCSI